MQQLNYRVFTRWMLMALVAGNFLASQTNLGLTTAADRSAPTTPFASHRLPLSFIPNQGQNDRSSVRFLARGGGGSLFFARDETVLVLPDTSGALTTTNVVRLRYQGANRAPEVRPDAVLPGVANYLLGNASSRWK